MDQRTTSGPAGRQDQHRQAEDMTAPNDQTHRRKITLDQRAPSRHDKALNSLYRCRGRKCGRNVGFWVYTVGVPDIEMEIPE
jgi:hypothetical protein